MQKSWWNRIRTKFTNCDLQLTMWSQWLNCGLWSIQQIICRCASGIEQFDLTGRHHICWWTRLFKCFFCNISVVCFCFFIPSLLGYCFNSIHCWCLSTSTPPFLVWLCSQPFFHHRNFHQCEKPWKTLSHPKKNPSIPKFPWKKGT